MLCEARWVREAIKEAYRSLGRDPPEGIKSHSTRSVAASWAQFNNICHKSGKFWMKNILEL